VGSVRSVIMLRIRPGYTLVEARNGIGGGSRSSASEDDRSGFCLGRSERGIESKDCTHLNQYYC
jgi:hypothetical protein